MGSKSNLLPRRLIPKPQIKKQVRKLKSRKIFFITIMIPLLIILPIVGSLILLPFKNEDTIKKVGLSVSLLTLVISESLWLFFDSSINDFQWLSKIEFEGLSLCLGIDGISLFFILLTTLLVPLCLIASWKSINKNVKEFIIAFLLMESALILVFSALDVLVFYIFFESLLIPMYIIIGNYGSRTRKIRAGYQFFLYTLVGSLLMLLGIIVLYFQTGSTDLLYLLNLENNLTYERELILWLAFFASFAVKVPMVPFHIWLPEAHVEAPTSGSVILAGILLKLGGYGFIRFSLSLFPNASLYFTPFVYALSIVAIIYTSLTTLRQIDLKKIIAYSSVAHMGFVTLGLFTFNLQGIHGGLIIMISHGFVSSALFLCVGILYDRYHSRLLKYYGGLAQFMPLFTIGFLFFTLANLGFPGTSSFVGEFLSLVGAFQISFSLAFFAATGMILGAAYSLWLSNRLLFGGSNPEKMSVYLQNTDINFREFVVLLPLVVCTLILGLLPGNVIEVLNSTSTYSKLLI